MEQRSPGNVGTAFQMVLDELDREVGQVREAGARAFESGHYELVQQQSERAQWIEEFRGRVIALRDDWERPATARRRRGQGEEGSGRPRTRTRHGEATPTVQYHRPILRALVELGGSARADDVLQRVEREMRPTLKPRDYETVPSDPNLPRWRNQAQWARNTLREDGRIEEVARNGIWEISDKGRVWLASESGG